MAPAPLEAAQLAEVPLHQELFDSSAANLLTLVAKVRCKRPDQWQGLMVEDKDHKPRMLQLASKDNPHFMILKLYQVLYHA